MLLETEANLWDWARESSKRFLRNFFFHFWVGRYNKTLNDWSRRKQWDLYSLDLNVPLYFASGNIESLGETKVFPFPLRPVIKCLILPLVHPCWAGDMVAKQRHVKISGFFPVKNTISSTTIYQVQNVRYRSGFWMELTTVLSTHSIRRLCFRYIFILH